MIQTQLASDPYRQLYEEAPIAYHEVDREGNVRSVNAAECRLLGYTAEEMVGRPVWEFVAPEHRELSRTAVFRKLSQQQALQPFLREHRSRDGRFLWLEIHETLIKDAAGNVLGIRSALLDVTERKRAEEEAQESRAWLRAALQSIGDGVIATDALGSVRLMNSVAEEITGWTEEAASGASIEDVCKFVPHEGDPFAGDGCWAGLFRSLMLGPAVVERFGLVKASGRNGASREISVTLAPIVNAHDEVTGIVLTFRLNR